jgi:putative transposase
MVGFQISQRRACELVGLGRSTKRYEAVEKNDDALRIRLRDLASVYVRYGMPRLYVLLRREGWIVNHKRVYRLYKEEGLDLRTKKRKKQVSQPRGVQAPAEAPRERWSMDFMSDALACGRRFRVLTLVDHFKLMDSSAAVSPAIEVDHSLTGRRVAEVLDRVAPVYGLPKLIQVDNGPEFISKALSRAAKEHNGLGAM